MKKTIGIFCLILLALLIAPTAATTWYLHDGDNIRDYTEISGAVDTQPGDIIFLYNGTYSHFDVQKPHLSIIGEGANLVTIDCRGGKYIGLGTEHYDADTTGTWIEGLLVTNSTFGITFSPTNPVCGSTFTRCFFDGMTESLNIRGNKTTFSHNIVRNSTAKYSAVTVDKVDCVVSDNLFINSTGSGLTLQGKGSSSNNTIVNNTFSSSSTAGLEFYKSGGDNIIYLNEFIDNAADVISTTSPAQIWNSTTPITYTYNNTAHTGYLGNFWSDYTGDDTNSDGVIDTPYVLPNGLGTDYAPLMSAHDAYAPPPEPQTRYVDDDSGADFTSISDAVAASNAGDTIVVRDGAYTENVLVDKHLVISTENGAGAVTVTAATTGKPVFDVDADGVTVEGFAVRGPTDEHVAGIEIVGFDNCIVRKNDCAGCYNGIHLGGDATGNTVEENSCHENTKRGLSLRDTVTGNLVYNNTCENNGEAEICIKDHSANNTIWANAFLGPVEILTGNTYHSPEEVTYTYRGGEYTGYVGNHYSRYTGIDGDKNGIGDTPMSFGVYKDEYPMMGEWKDGEITGPALTTVAVTPADAELEEKETFQFSAAGYDDTGEAMEDLVFTWTSSNTTVGSVNATGYFEALAGGTTTLTAESDGVQGTANVTVIALADLPTIRIVKYAEDGRTIADETTVTVRWMKKNLPIYGGENGVELHFQGPVFSDEWNETHPGKPYDFWDAEETVNANPGKINEVVKGTSVRDLCNLVGGAEEGNEIKLSAGDGYKKALPYSTFYNPPTRQGEAIIAWWTEYQGEVPAYRDGPRLFFMAPDGIFGNWDMHECLPERYWHYYEKKPSVAGMSVAKIDTIEILPAPREDWILTLNGAIAEEMSRTYYEHGVGCNGGIHSAEWTDDGKIWSGMPLWLLCGWVDDGQSHGTGAYRDDLADAGYTIVLIDYGPDGIAGTADDRNVELQSADVKRNNGYILANEIGGRPLEEGDWPLKLVGPSVPAEKQLGSIDAIRLTGLPGSDEGMALTLHKGWNFVSTPRTLGPGNDTVAVFGGVDCAGHSIFGYDGTNGWEVLKTSAPIKPLDGIWIYSNTTATVALTFDTLKLTTAPTKALIPGWNAIGFSDISPAPAKDALVSVRDAWAILIGLDARDQAYESSIINGGSGAHTDERDLNPGEGYWLFMRTGGTLAAISI
ncbi:MAG: NosD domain-containing protein [Methanofollis sp.]|nr:NosD domain-containing protein [Methanofollis sp.]MDD4254338.1 NosD domain-containing protein [Methanofollis sp.]